MAERARLRMDAQPSGKERDAVAVASWA